MSHGGMAERDTAADYILKLCILASVILKITVKFQIRGCMSSTPFH